MLTIADRHLGIWSALGEIHPEGKEQRCWNHTETFLTAFLRGYALRRGRPQTYPLCRNAFEMRATQGYIH